MSTNKATTVVFSVLLIMSMMSAPVIAQAPESAENPSPSNEIEIEPPSTENSALELKRSAERLLQDAELAGSRNNENGGNRGKNKSDNNKQRNLRSLQSTYEYFLSPNVVNSSEVFNIERRVAAQTQARAPDAAEKLAVADRVLAYTSIRNADSAVEVAQERELADMETVSSARESIEDAKKAYSRGTKHSENGASPVSRINDYKEAWEGAQSVITTIAEESPPQAEITRRRDPLLNEVGNESYILTGSVLTLFPSTTDATVSVNGEEVESISLSGTWYHQL